MLRQWEKSKTMLRIIADESVKDSEWYGKMLQNLAIAEASMIKTNSKALDHFIAIVKELERIYKFKFEVITQSALTTKEN
jgi:hypothetical protein